MPNHLYNFTLNSEHNCCICFELRDLITLLTPGEDQCANLYYFVSSTHFETFRFNFKMPCSNQKKQKDLNIQKDLEKVEELVKKKLNIYVVECNILDSVIQI